MVLHRRAQTIRGRCLRLERIHAKARLERRSFGNRGTPESRGGNARQVRYSNLIPIYRRGRRAPAEARVESARRAAQGRSVRSPPFLFLQSIDSFGQIKIKLR